MSSDISTPKGRSSVPRGGVEGRRIAPEVRLNADGAVRTAAVEAPRIACGAGDAAGSEGRGGECAPDGWLAAANPACAGGGVAGGVR